MTGTFSVLFPLFIFLNGGGHVFTGCPGTISRFSKWDKILVFDQKLSIEMRFSFKLETKMGGKKGQEKKPQSPDGQEAVLEAFKLHVFNAKVIELHALKIFKYDPIGLRNNFMVVYCDCENSAFLLLWEKYKEYIESLSYEFPIMGKLKEEESGFPAIKIARAIHKRYGQEVGITHLFLHTC